MNFDSLLFRRELAGWAVRGALCAAPSASWATLSDFRHPREVAAMILVVGLFIAGFAWFSAWEAMGITFGRERFVRALKMSAWIKAAMVVAMIVAWVPLGGGKRYPVAWMLIGMPDMWCGVGSLSLVGWLAGVKNMELGRLDSFSWTALTTLVQGVLVTLQLLLLSLGVLGWWRLLALGRRKEESSLARIAG